MARNRERREALVRMSGYVALLAVVPLAFAWGAISEKAWGDAWGLIAWGAMVCLVAVGVHPLEGD